MNGFLKKSMSHRTISDCVWKAYCGTSKGQKKLQKFIEEAKTYTADTAKGYKEQYIDYRYYSIKYGFSVTDYYLYRLYDLSEAKISTYISEERRCKMYDHADDKGSLHIMGNKKDFYDTYKRFMQPHCVFVESEKDKDAFTALCTDQQYLILKPVDGERGMGVRKVYVGDPESAEAAWAVAL